MPLRYVTAKRKKKRKNIQEGIELITLSRNFITTVQKTKTWRAKNKRKIKNIRRNKNKNIPRGLISLERKIMARQFFTFTA